MSHQTLEFKTEVKELLHLMIHSLYSHKEIFLRELISNASDAIDKARYHSLTDNSILDGDGDWKIKLTVDKENHSITVSDNGIGMNEEEIIKALGTIAHSGTKDFIKTLTEKQLKDNPELIGQFGVGFYSSFMVAERVVVISRKAGDPKEKAIRWESKADGAFTVESFEKDSRGTDVILFLNEENREYLDEWQIRSIVTKYSDYIEHPICMDVTKDKKTEEEILNSRKAIWLKDKSEITKEEYTDFYKHVSHDFGDPARVIHFKAEGTSEFSALLFIPKKAPFDLFYKEFKIGPILFVKRVQIMDHCEELLPVYLRFVKGVVESSDLPLNVSREILQNNRQVDVIKKNITKKVLDALAEMKNSEPEAYVEFYREFSRPIKEGIYVDQQRKEQLKDLLLFESTKTEPGKHASLKEYAERMKADQECIYYMTGESREEMEKSPYLEAFKEKDLEVLFLTDEIDEFIAPDLEYANKKAKSVTRGDVDLDKKEDKKEAEKKYKKVIDLLKDELKDDIKDIRVSGRLKDSPCCLVADEGDMDPNMERIMKMMGQTAPVGKRILEINPAHPLIESLNAVFEKDKSNPVLKEHAHLLYEQALLLEGSKLKDPAGFTKRISSLMAEHLNKA
ncbi:MAG: molecular chaperone HtpG [Bacteroidetes bacterium]|nr:molecular chaperone HtpG [Bacteroidota bacterium]